MVNLVTSIIRSAAQQAQTTGDSAQLPKVAADVSEIVWDACLLVPWHQAFVEVGAVQGLRGG